MEVILNHASDGVTIAAFDGRVLEFFRPAEARSERFHVAHVAVIQLNQDKQGKHVLEF